MTREIRTTRQQIFLSGESSKKIWKKQNCMRPHAVVLMNQIKNILREWQRNSRKHRLHMRRRDICQNSWSRCTNQKLDTPTTRWNLGKHAKIYHGITAHQHLIDPRQMASLKEPFDQHSAVWAQSRWMKAVWMWTCSFCVDTWRDTVDTRQKPHKYDDNKDSLNEIRFSLLGFSSASTCRRWHLAPKTHPFSDV